MRKVCEVYLVSSSATDERGVELTFPVSQYEMMDAFEQIHTKSPGDVYWQGVQRCFLTLIQLGKLFRQRIELEDGHTLVQMRGEIVKAVEFIHLPIHVPR